MQEIVGGSPSFERAFREVASVAPARCPVLILGETGTGKELAARAIHALSPRADRPFETVDCGAIPRELIESELFGHVRGAFTGATRDRRGAFELANGGTLFLDEIGELSAGAQTRLLRVLQEGRFRRVGDERAIQVDVRVVAATNRDLLAEVKAGRFRPDLYYRLSVFCIRLPALRDRKGDIALLVVARARSHGRRHRRAAAAPGQRAPAPPRGLRVPGQHPRAAQRAHRARAARAGPRAAPRGPEHAARARGRHRRRQRRRLRSGGGRRRARRSRFDDERAASAGAGSGGSFRGTRPFHDDDDSGKPLKRDVETTGAWVLDQLRRCDFNLSQAERSLARLRRSPAGRAAAPVADRSSLTYYFQGECFKAFVGQALRPQALGARRSRSCPTSRTVRARGSRATSSSWPR